MVCCSFLRGIFPTQGSNPGLLHCRQTLYHLSRQGSPAGTNRHRGTKRLKGKKQTNKQVGGAQIARCPKMPISASCWLPVVATAKGPHGVYNDGNRSSIRMRELLLQGTCPLLPRWQDQLVAFWILSAFPSPPRAPFLGRVLINASHFNFRSAGRSSFILVASVPSKPTQCWGAARPLSGPPSTAFCLEVLIQSLRTQARGLLLIDQSNTISSQLSSETPDSRHER